MRTILFRGYDESKDRFVFGNLIEFPNNTYGIIEKDEVIFTSDGKYHIPYVEVKEPSQYTNFNDKNGKPIFDNDYVQWESVLGSFIGQVEYNSGRYIVSNINHGDISDGIIFKEWELTDNSSQNIVIIKK